MSDFNYIIFHVVFSKRFDKTESCIMFNDNLNLGS